MTHSLLPPSSAHIWGAPGGCTGWVTMINSVPENIRNLRSAESIEGDAAHALASQMISSAARAGLDEPIREETVGTVINGTVITDEMFEACELYVDNVAGIMRKTRIVGGPFLGIEEHVDIHRVHEQSYGTPDVFLFAGELKTLYLWDFKYGHGWVNEFENWQLLMYAIGVRSKLITDNLDTAQLRINMRIVQPRAYSGDGGPIREWSISVRELLGYAATLEKNATIALSSGAVNRTGPHCRYCGARHICPDALKAGLFLYESASVPTIQNMSPAALGTQYSIIQRAKEQIECLESGFQEQIKYLLKSGQNVPGYTLEPSTGRETWNRPDSEIITMGKMLGCDLGNIKAVTPNQARKKNIDENVINQFSERRTKGMKVAKSNTELANKIFLTEGK